MAGAEAEFDDAARGPQPIAHRSPRLHPLLILVAMLLTAVALTHLVPAGRFDRVGKHVVAGTYREVPRISGLAALVAPTPASENENPARAASLVGLFAAVPAGMAKSAPLFFMVMFIGGAFGILRATGAIDAGVDRLLHLTSGNVYILAAGLIVLLSSGSTFMGFSSEYIALIPVVVAIGDRLGLPRLFAPAVVALGDFIGYTTSVTNPIVLGIAQPLAGVPLFEGAAFRSIVYSALLVVGTAYVLLFLKKLPKRPHIPAAARLSGRQLCVLLALVAGGTALIVASRRWAWESPELTAAFIALGVALAVAGGLRASTAADAFLEGMRTMLLPCLLIGLAASVGILLQSSQTLDTVVAWFAGLVRGNDRGFVGIGLMASEMGFGVLIPSASAKAAVSLPILTPIAHLSGVGGQTTVAALLLGSGMTNMITPTNPLLLAFLAAARVDYIDWVKFVWPLFVAFTAICAVAIYFLASAGV